MPPPTQPTKPLPPGDLAHVLEHTRPHWEALRGGRIFVTGATGFFGIWLLETFAFANKALDLGAELVGLTRDPVAFRTKAPHLASDSSIRLLQGDVRRFEFPEGHFTHCIHAGTTSGSPVPPLEMLETIVQGTTRTLEFAVSAGVRRFLFVSSGAVYGKQPSEMTHIPEGYMGGPDTMDPSSAYGEGKRVGELLCSIFHKEHGLETVVARCFAFVGPHLPLDAHFAIGNFIRDAMAGKPIQINGDGTPLRSYLYAADLATWLWTILFKGMPSYPYNVGSDSSLSIGDLARKVSRHFDSKNQLVYQNNFNTNELLLNYIPSINRASKELHLAPRTSLGDGLCATFGWYKSHFKHDR